MKENMEIEVTDNVFELEFGHPAIFYMQNFLFVIGVLGCISWPIISLLLLLTPLSILYEANYFVYGLNSIILFTLLSRMQQGIWIKKLLTFVNFTIGFMIVSTWLDYDILSPQGITILFLYLIASLWIYALIDHLINNPTSYSSVLLMMTPLAVFGTTLMTAKTPFIFFWYLLSFIFIIVLFQFLQPKKLEQVVEKLPDFPFLIPASRERSFLDIFNVPKTYLYTSNHKKAGRALLLEHIFFFLLTPALLFPAICLLDLRQTEESSWKQKLTQHIRGPPVKGMITPEDGSVILRKPVAHVARLLSVIARQRGWKKFSGNIMVFVDTELVTPKDLEVLELAERLSEADLSSIPNNLRVILRKVSFSHQMRSFRRLIQLTDVPEETLKQELVELERRGLVRLRTGEASSPRDLRLHEILQRARSRYERAFGYALSQVMSIIDNSPPFADLFERTKATLSMMITKVLLSNSDTFEKEFSEVSKMADDLFMHSTNLQNTVTSYQIPIEMQEKVVGSIFKFVRDNVKTRIEEPFGERVRWPWTAMNDGGDCDCKTVLIASMLVYLGFKVRIALITPGLSVGHTFVCVHLHDSESGKEKWWPLDPSDYRCKEGEVSLNYRRYQKEAFFIDLSKISDEIDLRI